MIHFTDPITRRFSEQRKIVELTVQTIEGAHSGRNFKNDYMRIVRDHYPKKRDASGIFEAIVRSIYTAGTGASAIDKRPRDIKRALCNFEPSAVERKSEDELHRAGIGASRKKVQGFIDAAKFVVNLEADGGFNKFFANYCPQCASVDERWGFVLRLARPIRFFRQTLACNFLKEIGKEQFAKPDRQLRRSFTRIFRGEDEQRFWFSEFDTFWIADSLGRASGRTPGEIDKLFWTLGSGRWPDSEGHYEAGTDVCTDSPKCSLCEVRYQCLYARRCRPTVGGARRRSDNGSGRDRQDCR